MHQKRGNDYEGGHIANGKQKNSINLVTYINFKSLNFYRYYFLD